MEVPSKKSISGIFFSPHALDEVTNYFLCRFNKNLRVICDSKGKFL